VAQVLLDQICLLLSEFVQKSAVFQTFPGQNYFFFQISQDIFNVYGVLSGLSRWDDRWAKNKEDLQCIPLNTKWDPNFELLTFDDVFHEMQEN